MSDMELAELWVAVAFFVFVGILLYNGVHKALAKALDARGARIAAELDEARRLKEEAQKLVAEYKRKQREAEAEAEAIVTAAKAEAERLAAETKAKLEEFVSRRTRMAEDKIAQAEHQALADVKAFAADAAVQAAERILAASVPGTATGDRLLGQAIQDVRGKLN
ncbi:F0F1 ATP synthase subunit B [Azorhizobium caulinodans]|uniref:ATP synthase subunit b 1 n=2 Tax=Azorhizobium TaxID=6 RepID=ATPF1_AZOC5|nr:RecName: Full=ATP synthase subunit b 1; AltName: Full=ATP synthase F(0) sector subunit b 1; AltName: Full=ATPase subunit I 1; AltName: Full=F-type ATPase subunit b 1; Short=F-ATPase subunit b 1 [Azorhizobium caulinodans ORS 571]TDT89439.1 F-type H+-transporting ATPase subunit b [Azorhizobium sp. AG788]BAF90261.1 putative Fo ATP synthase B chain [Azorhizobium caulinodans ORS 571]